MRTFAENRSQQPALDKEDSMKRRLVAAVVAGGLAVGVLASAASADPGVGAPTDPSCYGQNIMDFAQTFGGIRNAAATFDVTIQDGHNIVRAGFCDRTSGLVPAGG